MKSTICKCDVCGRILTDSEEFVSLKSKSKSFVTYANYDGWFPDRKTLDICTICLEHIGAATRGWIDRDGKSPQKDSTMTRMTESYAQWIRSIGWKPEYTPPSTKPQKKITESEMHMELDLLHDMIWFRYDDVGFCVQVPHGVIKKLKQQKVVKII